MAALTFDGEAFGAKVAEVIKSYVGAATAPLIERIAQLEAREAIPALPGKDGIGLSDCLIDKDGELVLTMSDGTTRKLGRVTGHDGATFTLDDFAIDQLDERTFDFRFTHGGQVHSFEFSFPVVLDRGVWSDASTYAKGDAVSWGGSLWIAQRDGPGKPDTADSGWRLAVKKGRDAR